MRKLSAHLALAAIYASLFAPLLAAHETSVHACCRRNGMHHCQPTNEAGFHAKTSSCPYSTPLPTTTIVGLEPAKFSIRSLAGAGVPATRSFSSYLDSAARDLSARAPPRSIL